MNSCKEFQDVVVIEDCVPPSSENFHLLRNSVVNIVDNRPRVARGVRSAEVVQDVSVQGTSG